MAFSPTPTLLGEPPWTRCSTRLCRRRATVSATAAVCLVDSLPEALERGYVHNFGRQIELDPNGFFPQSETSKLPSEYTDIFANVSAIIRTELRNAKVCAIFVRGSLVTGNLLPNFRSDVDLIVFTEKAINLPEKRCLRDRLFAKLRNSLQVASVDISCINSAQQKSVRQRFPLTPTLTIILRHFAVPIYGSIESVGMSTTPLKPKPHLSIEIRNDRDSFQRRMHTKLAGDNFLLQMSAIQWLCKRCLRAIVELAASKSGVYARDLLPCYHIGSSCYPEYAQQILHALLIACADPDNRYLNMRKGEILKTGSSVALQLAEIVEELFIDRCFGSTLRTGKESPEVVSRAMLSSTSEVSEALKKFQKGFFAKILMFKRHIPVESTEFRVWSLPKIKLKGSSSVHSKVMTSTTPTNFEAAFTDVPEPIVYTTRPRSCVDGAEETKDVLEALLRSVPTVQCRVARGNNVTFCRSKHKWMDEELFTPPSVLASLSVHEAVKRLGDCPGLPNLVYDGEDECIYIQTSTISFLRYFESRNLGAANVVQEERLWVSSHGTVSTLHYDASYSALYQRCGQKRLLFFPPSCLPYLGIYPLGHPLHRRGRVDLTREDTVIFRKFWEECAGKAIEVTLMPGDLLLFPPFWSHYTESITKSSKELSISHTLRYVYK